MRGCEDSLGVDAELLANSEAGFMLDILIAEAMLRWVYDSRVPVLHNGCLVPDG